VILCLGQPWDVYTWACERARVGLQRQPDPYRWGACPSVEKQVDRIPVATSMESLLVAYSQVRYVGQRVRRLDALTQHASQARPRLGPGVKAQHLVVKAVLCDTGCPLVQPTRYLTLRIAGSGIGSHDEPDPVVGGPYRLQVGLRFCGRDLQGVRDLEPFSRVIVGKYGPIFVRVEHDGVVVSLIGVQRVGE